MNKDKLNNIDIMSFLNSMHNRLTEENHQEIYL